MAITSRPVPLDDLDPQLAVAEAAAKQWPLFAEVDEQGHVRPIRDPSTTGRSGEVRGFSTHAAVCAAAGDTEKRRRIVRYCVRPPFASKQVSATSDGRVAFELRHPRSNGATHAVFSELGFVRKLAAIVPPPGRHEIRYFGALSSASPVRSEVVPTPPIDLHLPPAATGVPETGTPARTSAKRISWAALLQRVYGADALACPNCPNGRIRLVAAVTEPCTVKKILDHLDLNDEPPPARPRHPPDFALDA